MGGGELVFCESTKYKVGRKIGRYEIVYSYDVLKKMKDYYIVIAVNYPGINPIRLQLKEYGVKEYGIFFTSNFSDYEPQLRSIIIEAMNEVSFLGSREENLPYVIGNNLSLGIVDKVIGTTYFSTPIINWLYDMLPTVSDGYSVLDLGPGWGLISYIMKKINPDFDLSWLVFSEEYLESRKEINKYYENIKNKFNNHGKYAIYSGIIEDTSFKLEHKYDLIIMTEVMEHFVASPVQTLIKIARSLKENGLIYLSTPDWERLYYHESWKEMKEFGDFDNLDDYMEHHKDHNYIYNKQELFEIFELCGLEVVKYKLSDFNNHNVILKMKSPVSLPNKVNT